MTPSPATTNLKASASILGSDALRREHTAARQAVLALDGKLYSSRLVSLAEPWRGHEVALACWGFVLEQELRIRGMSVKERGFFSNRMRQSTAVLPEWVD